MTFIERTLGKTATKLIHNQVSGKMLLEVALGSTAASTGSSASTSESTGASNGPANADQIIQNKIDSAKDMSTPAAKESPNLGGPQTQTRSEVNTGYADMHLNIPSDTKPTINDTTSVSNMLSRAVDKLNT